MTQGFYKKRQNTISNWWKNYFLLFGILLLVLTITFGSLFLLSKFFSVIGFIIWLVLVLAGVLSAVFADDFNNARN